MGEKNSRKSGFELSQQEFIILSSLMTGPKHGYGIIKDIRLTTKKKINLSTATLYQNLLRMLENNLVEFGDDILIKPGEERKTYKITGLGETKLHDYQQTVQAFFKLSPILT
jgi:PadR family transcriptional regulator, regulatory protein PadR